MISLALAPILSRTRCVTCASGVRPAPVSMRSSTPLVQNMREEAGQRGEGMRESKGVRGETKLGGVLQSRAPAMREGRRDDETTYQARVRGQAQACGTLEPQQSSNDFHGIPPTSLRAPPTSTEFHRLPSEFHRLPPTSTDFPQNCTDFPQKQTCQLQLQVQ